MTRGAPLGPPRAASSQAGQMVYPVRSSPGPVTPGDGAKIVSWGTLREADSFVRGMGEKGTHWHGERAILHLLSEKSSSRNVVVQNFCKRKNNMIGQTNSPEG